MIIIGIIFFGFFSWCVWEVFRGKSELKKFFWPLLVIKSLAGIGVGLVYMFYYRTGDTLVFFNDGVRLAEFARTDFQSYLHFLLYSEFPGDSIVSLSFGDKRAILMDKIVSLFSLVSFDSYWLITFYVTAISFLASWWFVIRISIAFPKATGPAILSFLLFPSIVFWTSGLIKETIAMGALYFICGVFLLLWFKRNVSFLIILVTTVAIYLLWALKYYFAGIFLAVIFALLIHRFLSTYFPNLQHGVRSYVGWLIVFLILILGVTFLHPNFKSHRLMKVMVENYQAFHRFSEPGRAIHFDSLEPNVVSLMSNSPKALFAGLYRPLFFDANNVFAYVISIENVFLLIATLFSLRYVRKIFAPDVGVLLCAIVVYVILLAIFITLSTPNLGTLARYRVGYLPFFVFLILLSPPIAIRLQNILKYSTSTN